MKALTYFRKRGLALFLALAMCLTVLPGVALAEGETDPAPVLEGEQTDAAPALQSDEQTTVEIKVFLHPETSEELGWGNRYVSLGTIPSAALPEDLQGVGKDGCFVFTDDQTSALKNLLSDTVFSDPTKTVNTTMLDCFKLCKESDGWHIDVKYTDEAKKQDSVYVYMDTTTGASELTEAEQNILSGLIDLYKGRWATLGKIERIDLTNKDSINWDAEMLKYLNSYLDSQGNPNANFTAFQNGDTNNLTALQSLLESLTWKLSPADGANYGNGSQGSYVANGNSTYHLDGTITYFELTYVEQLDGIDQDSTVTGPSSILKNKTVNVGDLQTTLGNNGYTFGGWFLPNGDPFTPGVTKITADTQLIARWTSPTPEEPEIFIPIEFPDDIAPTPGTTTTIEDEETPLAGSVGLNNTDHFAYIEGYNDGTVRPLDNMTRAEAVTIFFRLMDDAYRLANWSTENRYTDVNAGDWYNNAVSTCVNAGILDAFTGSEFLPNQPITRAEFAVIAAGFAGEEFTGESVGDFDDTAGHWAAAEIRKAAEAGWVHGDKGSFQPDELITRADVVTLVNNMLDRVPDAEHMLPEMKTFSDNIEGEWYYEAIQEAANGHEYERDELGVVETWTELQAERDWAALEAEWAAAAAAEEE